MEEAVNPANQRFILIRFVIVAHGATESIQCNIFGDFRTSAVTNFIAVCIYMSQSGNHFRHGDIFQAILAEDTFAAAILRTGCRLGRGIDQTGVVAVVVFTIGFAAFLAFGAHGAGCAALAAVVGVRAGPRYRLIIVNTAAGAGIALYAIVVLGSGNNESAAVISVLTRGGDNLAVLVYITAGLAGKIAGVTIGTAGCVFLVQKHLGTFVIFRVK